MVMAAGCGGSSSDAVDAPPTWRPDAAQASEADARLSIPDAPAVDAPASDVDARVVPDALTEADAPISPPDATFDAPEGTPDAPEGTPDAPLPSDAAPLPPDAAIDAPPPPDAAPPPATTWTILVYGHGDHSLSAQLIRDIQEMAAATLAQNVRVLVLADLDASKGYPSGVSWLRVTTGQVHEVGVLPELDLDDPTVLATAIQMAFTSLPADRYGLVLWDHGGAWRGGFGGDSQNGTVAHPTPMSIGEVGAAVGNGLAAAGVSAPLDFIATDTCLLGGAETLAELVGRAQLFIGNGELDYGPGLDYTRLLNEISARPDITVDDLAATDAVAYAAHHAQQLVDRQLQAHIAVRLDRWPTAMSRLASFAATSLTAPSARALARAVLLSTPAYSNGDVGTLLEPGLLDLGQFLDWVTLAGDATLAALAASAGDALESAIVASSLGTLRRGAQHGMNVELSPREAQLGGYATRAAAWNDATHWGLFLQSLAAHADATGPAIVAQATAGDPVLLDFGTPDDDIAAASVYVATPDGVLYGLAATALIEPDTVYTFPWGGEVRSMVTSDGIEAVFVRPWSILYAADGTATVPAFVVPGLVGNASVAINVLLVVDPATGEAPLFVIREGSLSSTVPVSEYADQGLVFQPLVPFVDLLGNLDYVGLGVVPITGDALAVPIRRFAPGTYSLLLGMTDVWGNSSYAAYDVVLGTGAKALPAIPRAAGDAEIDGIERFAARALRGELGPAIASPTLPTVTPGVVTQYLNGHAAKYRWMRSQMP